MTFKTLIPASVLFAGAALFFLPSAGFAANPTAAQNVTKACSAKYDAAKKANTLHGQTWQQHLHDCSASMKGGAAAAPSRTYTPATRSPSFFTIPAIPDAQRQAAGSVSPLFSLAAETMMNGHNAQPTPRKMGYRQRLFDCTNEWHAAREAGALPQNEKWAQYWRECDARLKAGG